MPPPFQDLVDASQDLAVEYSNRPRPGLAQWRGSPFAWVLDLPPATKGSIGRRFFTALLTRSGLTVVKGRGGTSPTFTVNGRTIAVKFSTRWTDGAGYKFQQIRLDDYDLLACLGIGPSEAHLWVIPRDVAWRATPVQHRGELGQDTHWLLVDPDQPQSWLSAYGGTIDAAMRLLT